MRNHRAITAALLLLLLLAMAAAATCVHGRISGIDPPEGPYILRVPVVLDGRRHTVDVMPHEDVRAVVMSFCALHSLLPAPCNAVTAHVLSRWNSALQWFNATGPSVLPRTHEYWEAICPGFHTRGTWPPAVATVADTAPVVTSPIAEGATPQAILQAEGYLQLSGVQWRLPGGLSLPKLTDCAQRVREAGWPAEYVLVYDEFWALVFRARAVAATFLGPNPQLLTAYRATAVMHQERTAEAADRLPMRTQPWNSFHPLGVDGSLNYVNMFVSLTDTTPSSGCLNVLPKVNDPWINATREHFMSEPAPTTPPPPENLADLPLQHIRALPAVAGDIIIMDGELMRWASRPNPQTTVLRTNLDIAFQRANATDTTVAHWNLTTLPTLGDRLRHASSVPRVGMTVSSVVYEFIVNAFDIIGFIQ